MDSLTNGLREQTQEEQINVEEVRENDEWIEVPPLQEEEQLGKVLRYKIDDEI